MAKYKVTKTEEFDAIVEAKDEDEAYDIAHNEQDTWVSQGHCETLNIEKVGE